ncbi:MAG: hypothetical protein QOI58_1578 [Thermoanaerobaculia bacterium]|jgi:hypothetical protein|nr:hypothetical protein [Thermoanaerobaculia bacterium]
MLILPTPPAEAFTRVKEGLIPLLAEELDIVDDSDYSIEIARPQPIYTAGLTDVLSGDLLGNVRLTSWQFLVLRARQPFGSGEVDVERGVGGTETLVYGGFHLGPYARSVVGTLHIAEGLPPVIERDYEVRILRIPTVFLYCVWLHSEGHDDLLLPCKPAPTPLVENNVLEPATIAAALRDLAAYRLSVADADI